MLLRITTLALFILATMACAQTDLDPVFTAKYLQAKTFLKSKNYRAAIEACRSILEDNPTAQQPWLWLASALSQSKDYDGAIEAFTRAKDVGAAPKCNSSYNIACCYGLKGDSERALAWLQKSAEEGFPFLQEARNDSDLTLLRNDLRFQKLVGWVDIGGMTAEQRWLYDLDYLHREIMRVQYNPFLNLSVDELENFFSNMSRDIHTKSDGEIGLDIIKFMVRFGSGHTKARFLWQTTTKGNFLPLEFFQFEEGLFITKADKAHQGLIGYRIDSVGQHSISDVLKALEPYCESDNAYSLMTMQAHLLRLPRLLKLIGLVEREDLIEFGLTSSEGVHKSVLVSGAGPLNKIIFEDRNITRAPLYRQHPDKPYWFEVLDGGNGLYFQYNECRQDPSESINDLATRVKLAIEKDSPYFAIIDLRNNSGGDNYLDTPVLEAIQGSRELSQPGHLFVLIGRQTFSSGMVAASEYDRRTNAIFVGEPTGSRPNFIGRGVKADLPCSGMVVRLSDVNWQSSHGLDMREWISPEIYVPLKVEDWRSGRDAALEAVFKFVGAKTIATFSSSKPLGPELLY